MSNCDPKEGMKYACNINNISIILKHCCYVSFKNSNHFSMGGFCTQIFVPVLSLFHTFSFTSAFPWFPMSILSMI